MGSRRATTRGDGINRLSNRETVWGSVPAWRTGIPAIAFAGVAGILSIYAVLTVPKRVPEVYGAALEASLERYEDADIGDYAELEEAAGTINVAFSRLTAAARDKSELIWRWALFSREHAGNLERLVASEEFSDEELEEIEAKVSRFSAKASDNMEFLAAGDSVFKHPALVNVSFKRTGEALRAGAIPPMELAPQLDDVAASENADDDQNDLAVQASALQSYILFENAFRDALQNRQDAAPAVSLDRVRMSYGQSQGATPLLVAGRRLLDAWDPASDSGPNTLPSEPADGDTDAALPKITSDSSWEDCVAVSLTHICDGDWNSLSFLLSKLDKADVSLVSHVAARWVSRLAESELPAASPQWLDRLPDGLQLCVQIAPQNLPLTSLLWRIGMTAADAEYDEAVDEQLVETIVSGRSPILQHAALAISSCADKNSQTARSHVQLVQRATASVDLLVSIVLGRLRGGGAEDGELQVMLDLCDVLGEVDSASGIPAYAKGLVAYEMGNLKLAVEAMNQARAVLSENEAIAELALQFQNELEARAE